jgi:hypothetical protein
MVVGPFFRPLRIRGIHLISKAIRRPPISAGATLPGDVDPLAIVVPVFSLTNRLTGRSKDDPKSLDRIRMLEFPEFI